MRVEAVADQRREDLALERHRPAGRDAVEHLALQHVGAGVDQAAVDRARLGFSRNSRTDPSSPARTRP